MDRASIIRQVVIVDDFYTNPFEIRNAALEQKYNEPVNKDGSRIRGRIAKFSACADELSRLLTGKVQKQLFNNDIKKITKATVQFRYSLAGAVKKVICHVDDADYAGIVYLSLPEHCKGGTSFFRHVSTGHCFKKNDSNSIYEFKNSSEWEKIHSVDMKFNRLVMYPGKLFHAITPVFFGDCIENARLTQNIFLNISQ